MTEIEETTGLEKGGYSGVTLLNNNLKPGYENIAPVVSGDEDSKESASSSNPDVTMKEYYEEAVLKDETNNEIEIYDCHSPDEDVDDCEAELFFSDTEDSIMQTRSGQNSKKKRTVGPYYDLHYKCEWKNCTYESDEDSKFHVHVSYHIPDVEVKTLGTGEEVYVCLWAECTYLTGGANEIQRHVTYHSYHTRLKNIGEKLSEEWELPKCQFGNETRNTIPETIDRMVCEWKECSKEFNNVQVFLHHTQMHVNECFIEVGSKEEIIKCKWNNCLMTSSMPSRTRLSDHMRTHTREKVVGCPVCGQLFATNTKLHDHVKRQTTNHTDFQCTHCYKYYANLRLLKEHLRGHVNYYKCCYCDMTCTTKNSYSAHIRYRHLDSKPFKCIACSYRCKTQFDLKAHVMTHDPEAVFVCEETDCNFQCRSKVAYQRHLIDDHHVSSQPVYCCHLPGCKSRYKRGYYLTKHLMQKHCLRWPSGHSKFTYHRQPDGIYRLKTVRYESMELFNHLNKKSTSPSKATSTVPPSQVEKGKSYKVSNIESDSSSGVSQVFITIEDASGNTINSCTASEVLCDKIPKNATIIASAESIDSENDSS